MMFLGFCESNKPGCFKQMIKLTMITPTVPSYTVLLDKFQGKAL